MKQVNMLEGSWDTYNNRKIASGQDPNYFTPEEVWELNYLVDMILASKPHLDHLTVMLSVREGMRRTMAPRPRQHFVEVVMDNLKNRENQWIKLMKSMENSADHPGSDEFFNFN